MGGPGGRTDVPAGARLCADHRRSEGVRLVRTALVCHADGSAHPGGVHGGTQAARRPAPFSCTVLVKNPFAVLRPSGGGCDSNSCNRRAPGRAHPAWPAWRRRRPCPRPGTAHGRRPGRRPSWRRSGRGPALVAADGRGVSSAPQPPTAPSEAGGMIVSDSRRPRTSDRVQPKMSSAPRFQWVMRPSSSMPMKVRTSRWRTVVVGPGQGGRARPSPR